MYYFVLKHLRFQEFLNAFTTNTSLDRFVNSSAFVKETAATYIDKLIDYDRYR